MPSPGKVFRNGTMAQTEHLPIYKRTYDLCLYFEQIVQNFPRYHKYSLARLAAGVLCAAAI